MQNTKYKIKNHYRPHFHLKSVKGFLFALLLLLFGTSSLWAITEEEEYNIAWQYCQSGKYPQAVEAYQKFLKHHPRGKLLAEAHFTLARIENSGTNAFAHYQFIIDNYPAHALAPQAAFATAQYCQNAGAYPEAKVRYLFTYSRYAQTPPGSESLYRLSLMALAGDSLTQAASYAQAFVQQYPQNFRGAAISRSLADCWRLKADSAQANFYWRQIMELYPESYEAGEAREQLLADIEGSPEALDDSLSRILPAPKTVTPVIKSPPVKMTQLNPKPAAGKKYYLQIGVYREKSVMTDWKKRLEKQDHQCRVDSSGSKNNCSYRLYAGPYDGKEEALKISQKLLISNRLKTMLVQK
ncbi:tetratricopeptide repeat protein [candidate division TA06 bacterium]|uniref:Tetratricopeptide repeat protein n=1 Tax=candidate division TA06 bacterium TaxID=2250710 RepID=A0A933MIJ2_UNCT6|nr:tetratricopeptide repeat protein [candidate division TA06 bacterium]